MLFHKQSMKLISIKNTMKNCLQLKAVLIQKYQLLKLKDILLSFIKNTCYTKILEIQAYLLFNFNIKLTMF